MGQRRVDQFWVRFLGDSPAQNCQATVQYTRPAQSYPRKPTQPATRDEGKALAHGGMSVNNGPTSVTDNDDGEA